MEYAKKIVLGISVYLIAKGVLNLVLGSFAFGNIVSLAVQIVFVVVLLSRIRYSNYVISVLIGITVIQNLPANLGNLPANLIYLLEGIFDIGVIALLVLAKDVRAFFDSKDA